MYKTNDGVCVPATRVFSKHYVSNRGPCYTYAMTLEAPRRRYTVEEYLRLEAESEERHEYWDGYIVSLSQVIGMAGGTYEHSVIGANVIRVLGNKLEGGPCRVMSPDMRIKVPRTPLYVYPDASVVCGPPAFDPQAGDRTTLLNPRVIVEVVSPSTEVYDRGKKLARYIEIDSLQEYVIVAQSEPRVDTYYRDADGSWAFGVALGIEAVVRLRSLDVTLPLREIYAGVEFPPDSDVTPGISNPV